jgi:cytochrome P450
MTIHDDIAKLDRDRLRELFDLRNNSNLFTGGDYADDPNPAWNALRAASPVHEGTLHSLTGIDDDLMFHGLPYPESPHFTAFTHAALDDAYRNEEVFASSANAVDPEGELGFESTMLSMGGAQHRRYRALVQPSFVPAKAQWWITNWIGGLVEALVDGIVAEGRAELNVDFCAPIPVMTITGSFGISVERALDVRESMGDPMKIIEMLTPIIEARRAEPSDDLISVLVESEITDEDGVSHRLSDAEIHSFALLLLAAGSGTTWKQMGIALAALLERPDVLAEVRDDRTLLKAAIEESLRWTPTDPMFSRWVTQDIDFHGTHVPKGAVMHLCLGAANRDPARWEDRPDEFDIHRPMKPSMGFGGGAHICLGMHVARAEMATGINALLDRLPNLRLDPDAAPPRPVGFYERGVMEIPVIFDD